MEIKLILIYYAQETGSHRSGTVYLSLTHTYTLLNSLCHELSAIQVTVITRVALMVLNSLSTVSNLV